MSAPVEHPAGGDRAARRERLGWLWRRLRAMGPQEIAWRVRQAARARLEAAGFARARPREPSGTAGRAWVSRLPRELEVTAYRSAADRVLAGRFDVFAMRDLPLGFPPDWMVDPKTGVRAPGGFGERIDYRDASLCGDIKYLWEPSRHLELVTLAQAWHLSGDVRYAQGCRRLLVSWFDQCPYPDGPHWTSSLEHGIRLINWAVAWHLLGGEASPVFEGEEGTAFRARWLRSVREHCHFVAGHLSLHSSANNHLLGETAGLAVGAMTWPLWPESARWTRRALGRFEHEALAQTHEDGVNREQAIWYQHAVMELMLITGLFARANDRALSAEFWGRLSAMMDYLAALGDRSGHWPMLGDSDDSTIVRWDPRGNDNPYRSLLSSGAVLFDRGDWVDRSAGYDDRNRWLFGDDGLARFPTRRARDGETAKAFEHGGRYVLGERFGTAREVLASFDAGPLGYLSIAAHGHADALSLTLSAAGVELLVDPGTYAYHTDKRWRDYFRSTFAHNTVCVDDLDQSVSGGNFLWLRKAVIRQRAHRFAPEVQQVAAEHDGYTRLDEPIVHRREITYRPGSDSLLVDDGFTGRGEHRGCLCWHLPEAAQVSVLGPDRVRVSVGDVRMTIAVAGAAAAVQPRRGQDDPPAGWVSRRFDDKQPGWTLVWPLRVADGVRVSTRIDIDLSAVEDRPAPVSVEASPPARASSSSRAHS